MWAILFVVASVSAIISDMNCTSGGTYAPVATACSNYYSDQTCLQIYLNNTAVTPGGSDERPSNCFNGTNGPSADVKNLAIASCAKLCGYCCQTPAYNCKNVAYPRINCATVTQAMCQSPQWRTVIAQDCPNTCGFCLLSGCIDAAPDCASQPTVCVTKGLESFVATNCQSTCGLCSSTTATCTNTNANCANWVKNGFCNSQFYTTTQKQSYCASSCGLCSGK